MKKVSRIGVYGIARKQNQILLITQEKGPYAQHYDLPGGGIEFGETPEETLHREFSEEVGMDFKSMKLLTNITHLQDYPDQRIPFTFHQIGLIYEVHDLFEMRQEGCLKHAWVNIETIKNSKISPFIQKLLVLA